MGQTARRKTVTVLFADLVESTSMAENADAEALAEQLSAYFDQMRAIIERHGGTVEKYIGDAVVGMFGVPLTHEDDALRAIRAALEMQRAMPETRMRARIGVNTGEVAVGRDGGEGRLALGHSISMAARLEQAAEAGTVLIGGSTHQLVREAVQAHELSPILVKGSSVPLDAWLVTGLVDSGRRGWDGGRNFVGRTDELAQIESAFRSAVEGASCVVVTVVAPPGMGKSRLAAEATRRLARHALVLVGRCAPYGESTTYTPLSEMAASPELAADSDTVARARQALTDTALASPEETAWAFKQMLESQAEQRPVVAVVDDLHWAEPLLLDLLDYVITFSVERPILLLCLARPDLFDTRPEWATPRPNALTLRLEPLTPAETDVLLDSGGWPTVDEDVRRRVLDAAGGVPLFVEQLAAFRAEGDSVVPPSVRALLSARIDRLHEPERAVLERAAIQGQVFDRATVAQLVADSHDTPLATSLVNLVRREFIRPERSADRSERFSFSHALLRDAVYEQMPRRLRAQLHDHYARLLATSRADPELIGHQLGLAYAEAAVVSGSDATTLDLALRAGAALQDAGLRALARKEWQHARQLLERALDMFATEPADGRALLPALLQAHGELGDMAEASRLHARAIAEARTSADVTTELRAEIEWMQLRMRRGDVEVRERVGNVVDRALEHFRAVDDDAGLALTFLFQLTRPGISMTEMVETLREAKVHAERAGDERTLIEVWDELGGAMIFGPTPYPEIAGYMQREVEWARERGIAFVEADGLLGEAYALDAAGDITGARRTIASVRDLFAQLPGFVSQLGESDLLAASIELQEANYEAAEALCRRAKDVLQRGGHVPWWTTATLALAHVLMDQGRPDESSAALDEVEGVGPLWSSRARTLYLQGRARLAAVSGDLVRAIAHAREAVSVGSDTDTPQSAARAHELLGELLARAGDDTGSIEELTLALDLYAAKGYRPGERRVAARL